MIFRLVYEYLSTTTLSVVIKKYIILKEKLFADSRESKNRDDIRGRRIIPVFKYIYKYRIMMIIMMVVKMIM